MYATKLRLRNWMRFRGEHEIELGPMVYAITARHESDPGRSNWFGKSSFVEAFRFALFGKHRFERDDEWITEGESEGFVELVTTEFAVRRSKKRGKATQVAFKADPLAVGELRQKAATAALEEALGMSDRDFSAVFNFRQGMLAEFVKQRPADRFKIVSSWLELAPLERCHAEASSRLSKAVRAYDLAKAKRDVEESGLFEIIAATLPEPLEEGAGTEEHVEAAIEACLRASSEIRKRLEEQGSGLDAEQLAKWNHAARGARDYDEAKASYDEIKAEGDALWDPEKDPQASVDAESDYREQVKVVGEKRARLGECEALARGEFDGSCPIGGVECPIRSDLNARTTENQERYDIALEALGVAVERSNELRGKQKEIENRSRKFDKLSYEIDAAKRRLNRARAGKALIAELGNPPEVSVANVAAQAEEAARVEKLAEDIKEGYAALQAAEKALEEAKRARAVAGLAAEVFGPRGAQRRVAEKQLREIAAGAQRMLRASSIPLAIDLSWGRESATELARNCSTCGAAFPKSRKVRECASCGAPRGAAIQERLDVILSDQSGAAEDLAGASLSLSAATWLRANRGIRWASVLIDEPFGQLDGSNRAAFANYLSQFLGGDSGFSQAFVISHSPDINDSLPGQIQIVAGPRGSRVEVFS